MVRLVQKTNRVQYAKSIHQQILKSLQGLIISNLKKTPPLNSYWLGAIQKSFNDPEYARKVEKDSIALANHYIDKVNKSHALDTKKEYKKLTKQHTRRTKDTMYSGTDLEGFTSIDLVASMSQVSAADLIDTPEVTTALKPIIEDNIGLIRSIPTELLPQVEKAYTDIISTSGFDQESILKMLTRRFSVAKSRAKLIATDQVGKTIGQLTKIRHQEAGITHFKWRTSEDSEVRPTHAALDGKIFDWDHLPIVGAPGQPIRCRCTAEPHIVTF